jgi:hypothetical protein
MLGAYIISIACSRVSLARHYSWANSRICAEEVELSIIQRIDDGAYRVPHNRRKDHEPYAICCRRRPAQQ